jgi:hypothetical protein
MAKTRITQMGILIKGPAAVQLRERARFLGTTPEELGNRVILEYLKEHGDETVGPNDERFKAAAALLIKRNSKLYRRLAQ